MAKQDIETTEYTWDDGTYQTGASQPGKGQSGLIAGLLAATIFLGSIASALGIMNIRLLRQLGNQNRQALPVSLDATGTASWEFLAKDIALAPELPEQGHLELQMSHELAQPVDPAAVTAKLTVIDNLDQEKAGTAVILSADGYLLTNAHLTDSARSISAQLPDGQIVPATLVACDPYSDLAVVYVGAQGLTPVTFSPDPIFTTSYLPTYGDSGLVFEEDGRLKGMLCRDLGTQMEGMLYPQQLMDIAKQLTEKGCVSGRPCLGLQVQLLSNFCRKYWNLEQGLEVTDAQTEGLLAGDILLKANGDPLQDSSQLYRLLLAAQPGDSVTLEIFRAGQYFTVTVPVITNP